MCIGRDYDISFQEQLISFFFPLFFFSSYLILFLPLITLTSLKRFLSVSGSENRTKINRKPLRRHAKFVLTPLLLNPFALCLSRTLSSLSTRRFLPLRTVLICFYMRHSPHKSTLSKNKRRFGPIRPLEEFNQCSSVGWALSL